MPEQTILKGIVLDLDLWFMGVVGRYLFIKNGIVFDVSKCLEKD
jgi:hypothetical protein